MLKLSKIVKNVKIDKIVNRGEGGLLQWMRRDLELGEGKGFFNCTDRRRRVSSLKYDFSSNRKSVTKKGLIEKFKSTLSNFLANIRIDPHLDI